MKNIQLLIIDPQNDFVDSRHGSLAVAGAEGDMDRLAALVDRLRDKLSGVHITLDSHLRVDISHPLWWRGPSGERPGAFTQIAAADVADGVWRTSDPSARERTLSYLRQLDQRGRYPHTVWPEHCLIGDEGHNVWPTLSAAVHRWEERYALPNFVTKGTNRWTEHFSAVCAEVPDPADASTQLNRGLIDTLEDADLVLVAGEARSHCVANTVRDIADHLRDPSSLERMVLLTDATSDVADPPGTTLFSDLGARFLRDMTARGMKTATTTAILDAA